MKNFIATFLGTLLFATSAYALCISQTSQTAVETCLDLGNGPVCEGITDADLGSPGNKNKQAVLLAERLQARIDERRPRASIVFDEPNKNTDPKTDREFWGNTDGEPQPDTGDYMITRCALVTVDVIDGNFRVSYSRTN